MIVEFQPPDDPDPANARGDAQDLQRAVGGARLRGWLAHGNRPSPVVSRLELAEAHLCRQHTPVARSSK